MNPSSEARLVWKVWSKQATILMGQQKAMTTKVEPGSVVDPPSRKHPLRTTKSLYLSGGVPAGLNPVGRYFLQSQEAFLEGAELHSESRTKTT